MALLDLLAALIGHHTAEPTTVDGLTVSGTRQSPMDSPQLMQPSGQNMQLTTAPPQPTLTEPTSDAAQTNIPHMLSYDNSGPLASLGAAMRGQPTPRGGSANPGIYGLLPQNLQHGTLRNVLGALGDAFLVQGGHPAQYGPRMEQQQIGNAMAGIDINDPQSVSTAIQRIAATGSPGSIETAIKLQQEAAQAAIHRDTAEQTALYRTQVNDLRRQAVFRQMGLAAQGDLSRATSREDYSARLARWTARAKAVDPNADAATEFAVPTAENWQPGSIDNLGVTSNQYLQSTDRGLARSTSERNTDVRASAIMGSAGLNAGSRIGAANISANRPSDPLRRQELAGKIDAGTATGAERTEWEHLTQVGGNRRRPPPAAAAAAPARAPTPKHYSHISVSTDGKHHQGWTGTKWEPID